MANVRIKDLTTTAATTASDDFFGVDGATNGTRKLNAFSPTFGGNLTVSGTGTSSFAGPVTGTSSVNDYEWTLTGSGFGGPFLKLNATNATNSNRFTGLVLANNSTTQWVAQLRAGDGKFHIYDAVRAVSALTVDVGPSNGVAGTTTVGGNLTVSGRNTLDYNSTVASHSGLWLNQTSPAVGNYSLLSDGTTLYLNVPTGGTLQFRRNNVNLGIIDGNFLLGTATNSGNGMLQLATHTTSAGGIGFGTDTSLYRTSAGVLRIDNVSGSNALLALADSGVTKAQFQVFLGDLYIDSNTAGKSIVLRSGNATTALTLDSSQRCILSGALRLANTYVATPQVSTGYVTIQDSTGTTYKVLVAT